MDQTQNPFGFPPTVRLHDGPLTVVDDAVQWWPYAPGETDRVVILLHGLGSHEGDLISLAPSLPEGYVYASLRGVLGSGGGYAWLQPPPVDGTSPALLEESAAAVESWIERTCPGRVAGLIGFSQGAMLALQLLRRDPEAAGWVAELSGAPFPDPMAGDEALAAARPPAFWGHGAQDPLFPPAREELVRTWLTEHLDVTEVRSPQLGHGIDEQVLAGLARFVAERG